MDFEGPVVSPITDRFVYISGFEVVGYLEDNFTKSSIFTKENECCFAVRDMLNWGIKAWVSKKEVKLFDKLTGIGIEKILIRPITSSYRVKSNGNFENRQKVSMLIEVNVKRKMELLLDILVQEGVCHYVGNEPWPLFK